MRKLLPGLSVLGLILVAAVAYARDREKVAVRTLLLSEHPGQSAHRVYVKGQVVTVLRFEQPCDPARTKLLGGEGRFEPVAVDWLGHSRFVRRLPSFNLANPVPLPWSWTGASSRKRAS